MIYWLTGSYSGNEIDDDGCRLLPEDLDSPPFYTGVKLADQWSEPFLRFSEGELFDVISYTPGAIVFSRFAKELLEPYIGSEVEFLPISPEGKDLYVVNVTNVIDCLDHKSSEFRYHSDGKTIRTIRHYEFMPGMLSGVNIFKIPEAASVKILCTQQFKDLVEKLQIRGINCGPIL